MVFSPPSPFLLFLSSSRLASHGSEFRWRYAIKLLSIKRNFNFRCILKFRLYSIGNGFVSFRSLYFSSIHSFIHSFNSISLSWSYNFFYSFTSKCYRRRRRRCYDSCGIIKKNLNQTMFAILSNLKFHVKSMHPLLNPIKCVHIVCQGVK